MNERLKELARPVIPLVVLGLIGAVAVSLLYGDGCGPVERGIRGALGTWDMWNTQLQKPHEAPLPRTPEGVVVAGNAKSDYSSALLDNLGMSAGATEAKGQLAYRRFCQHCHGPAGAGRSIVGESFAEKLPDLRSPKIQSKDDETLFHEVRKGKGRMIPLADTLTPKDLLLAIRYLRTLKDKPSKPVYPPRNLPPAKR